MFKARDGYVLIGGDYSQQEVRILAHLTQDESLINAYKEGKDIYSWFASITYNLSYEDCLEFRPDGSTNYEAKERRAHLKAIVLGILYGKSSKAIAEDLNISQEKADDIFNTFFKRFPSVKSFMESTQQMAKDKGYVKTVWGRKRHLPEMQLDPLEVIAKEGYAEDFNPFLFKDQKNSLSNKVRNKRIKAYYDVKGGIKKKEIIADALKDNIIIKDNFKTINDTTRQCVNSVIQGSAGEMIKVIMIEVAKDKILNDLDFHLLLTIHD